MGYPKRPTKGWLDCRPMRYHLGQFPRPASICSFKCIYYIFCNMELNKNMTLGERIKKIRLILQRPFHIFSYLPNDEEIMLILEGAEPNITRLSFRGKSMVDAVKNAEEYIEREKKMGSLKVSEDEKNEEETNEEVQTPPQQG